MQVLHHIGIVAIRRRMLRTSNVIGRISFNVVGRLDTNISRVIIDEAIRRIEHIVVVLEPIIARRSYVLERIVFLLI